MNRYFYQKVRLGSYFYMVFALILLICSWETERIYAAIAPSVIPEQSVRLRIVANSDAPRDQWIKREISNALVAQMKTGIHALQNVEETRQWVEKRIPMIERTIQQLLGQNGFTYSYSLRLGKVAFPEKIYKNQVYPAGEYEALLITLGEGKGRNWWCVLFPPLCFADMVSSKSETSTQASSSAEGSATSHTPASSANENSAVSAAAESLGETQPEIRFFVWDLMQKFAKMLENLI